MRQDALLIQMGHPSSLLLALLLIRAERQGGWSQSHLMWARAVYTLYYGHFRVMHQCPEYVMTVRGARENHRENMQMGKQRPRSGIEPKT